MKGALGKHIEPRVSHAVKHGFFAVPHLIHDPVGGCQRLFAEAGQGLALFLPAEQFSQDTEGLRCCPQGGGDMDCGDADGRRNIVHIPGYGIFGLSHVDDQIRPYPGYFLGVKIRRTVELPHHRKIREIRGNKFRLTGAVGRGNGADQFRRHRQEEHLGQRTGRGGPGNFYRQFHLPLRRVGKEESLRPRAR